MKQAALRGLIVGLALAAGVLAMPLAFRLGMWGASVVHPHRSIEVYLNIR